MVRNAIVRRPASLLDDFFNDEFFLPSMPSQNHLDVYQEDKNYVVEVDLPGYKKDEIHISYDQDLLTIKAEHKEEKKEDNKIIEKEPTTPFLEVLRPLVK